MHDYIFDQRLACRSIRSFIAYTIINRIGGIPKDNAAAFTNSILLQLYYTVS